MSYILRLFSVLNLDIDLSFWYAFLRRTLQILISPALFFYIPDGQQRGTEFCHRYRQPDSRDSQKNREHHKADDDQDKGSDEGDDGRDLAVSKGGE